MKKPTFVFDLGNVIVYYKPDEYLKRFGLEGERAAEFKRATFNDPVWLDCDAGLVTREEEIEIMCSKHPELEADIRRIIGGCNEMLQPIPESIRALKRLTMDGYDCYFLSNTTASAMEYMNGFDYMGMFKGGIESYAVKLSKPDHAIFRLFAERFQVEPGECVFIDDNPQNVAAARECGFRAHCLEDADGLYALTREILRGGDA